MTAPVSTCLFKVEETIAHLEDCKTRLAGWPQNSRLQKSKFQTVAMTSFALREEIMMLTDAQVRKTSPDYCDALGLVPQRKKPRVADQDDVDDFAVDDAPAAIVQASQSGSVGDSLDNGSAAMASDKLRWGCSVQ